MSAGPVFVTLNESGAALARRLMAETGGELHGFEGRVAGADRPFARVQTHLREIFTSGRPLICIMSSGIVIRALGALVTDKFQEAPVLAVAEDGSAVVPLLGGHRGGNRLARELAAALGVEPAITTAGDARFNHALDDPPAGWRAGDPAAAKPVMAALLAGEPVRLDDRTGPDVEKDWLELDGVTFSDDGKQGLILTEDDISGNGYFALHPQILALGVGCERNASAKEVAELARSALSAQGLSPKAVACVATLDLKEDEPAIAQLASELEVPVRLFTAAALEAETHRVTDPSEAVFQAVGCHSVAEAAALAAAGPDAELIVPKTKSRRATCAIARAPGLVQPENAGRAPGRLTVVGIGPGDEGWRAPAATSAIAEAEDLVGYSLYIELLGGLAGGRTLHAYDLGEERDRVIKALDLAASGRRVALISSGDAGIYAMAALVFELVDSGRNDAWRRLDIRVEPGISALQAAAARAGAPLGHDFCAISLSDLMTPGEVIEKRLRAAADGDFVIALYNPVSKRRKKLFDRAREIIAAARPADTPVILAKSLGRPEESIDVRTLAELRTEDVDMLTLVLIGSSETRIIERAGGRRVYTPRGYGAKP